MSLLSACQTMTEPRLPTLSLQEACRHRHIVSIDYDGRVLAGSKQRLIATVLDGESISVGWALDWNEDGVDDIIHWHGAKFLSVFEDEVFTQTPQIEVQRPQSNEKRIRFEDIEKKWVGLIGTTGQLENRFGSDAEPNTMRAKSWWCLQSVKEAT